MNNPQNTAKQRYVPAPIINLNNSGGVQGVWLNEDEDVDWTMGMVNGQSVVYGYTIKKKTSHAPKIR